VETIKALVDAKIRQEETECVTPQELLIQRSNEYASAIAKEVAGFFRAVKAVYGRKFPELESIVTQPALYCKAVREIERGETAFAYLSNHQRISLQIAVSSVHEQLGAGELAGVL
jgi:RNA processing factor Prp31